MYIHMYILEKVDSWHCPYYLFTYIHRPTFYLRNYVCMYICM
jgi:hypothetical protein